MGPYRVFTADDVMGNGSGDLQDGLNRLMQNGMEIVSVGYDSDGLPTTFIFKAPATPGRVW